MLQLTVPPTRTGLVGLGQAAAEVGGAVSVGDPRVGRLVREASAACENFCGRHFGLATWIETTFATDYPVLLSRMPVVELVSVRERGLSFLLNRFSVDQDAGILYRLGYALTCAADISVTYRAGYILPDPNCVTPGDDVTLPADVMRACLEVFKAFWFSGGDSARDPTIRSESVDGISSTSYLDPAAAAGGLPLLAASLLEPYRRFGI